MKRLFSILFLGLFFLGLLCFPALSISGASSGILLWFQKVLPVLLPFVLASRLMAESRLMNRFSPKTCGIVMGFLCGYPMGAIWAASLVKSGRISVSEGQKMVIFCNQPSPMFLTGYIGIQCLGISQGLPLLFCALAPSLLAALLALSRSDAANYRKEPMIPLSLESFERCFLDSCETLVKIGGYILLFSILASWITLLPLPGLLRAVLLGICEMTTGTGVLGGMQLPVKLAAPLCFGLATFGGLSCIGQTGGCLKGSGIKLAPYAAGRAVLGLLTGLLCYCCLQWL
ncbi:hypothetical protein MUB23_03600 [Cuneatibacter sp. NSJ-177]|uniref:hypothetical protein n=1 Tax=Cuneatibacter sp. NSJ-177 TaxID=2931401 RepID=UPI001FD07EDC|nr:hypothetical protein [Cuneatibacter sp. NSJ-177]MCJ7834482.1 hypothetical protein [Cuneatibacter sp. NSJ-177]